MILYNKAVYAKLGLQVPEDLGRLPGQQRQDQGGRDAPAIEGSFKDTWTTQLIVLGDFYNVQKADPTFAADYTANKAKYAIDAGRRSRASRRWSSSPPRATTTRAPARRPSRRRLAALAAGKAGQYPMLSTVVVGAAGRPAGQHSGFFGHPG